MHIHTERLAHTTVQDNCLLKVMGQEICQLHGFLLFVRQRNIALDDPHAFPRKKRLQATTCLTTAYSSFPSDLNTFTEH